MSNNRSTRGYRTLDQDVTLAPPTEMHRIKIRRGGIIGWEAQTIGPPSDHERVARMGHTCTVGCESN